MGLLDRPETLLARYHFFLVTDPTQITTPVTIVNLPDDGAARARAQALATRFFQLEVWRDGRQVWPELAENERF